MAIHVVRLGHSQPSGRGPRLGTVRRPPRGVPKGRLARYYDVWLPELAPSAPVVAWALASAWTEPRWRQFTRKYRAEMRRPAARHLIETLAALSHHTDFAVGCYCENASRCHRRVLQELLAEAGATIASAPGATR